MGKKKIDTAEEPLTDGTETTDPGVNGESVAEVTAADIEAESANDYQAEAARNKDLYLRALADLENYRKRAAREKDDAIRFANSNLLREMIPVIDNLERAVDHAISCEGQDPILLEGVQMTLVQFRKVLEGFGVKVVESYGESFNPDFHQAMGEIVTADYPPGCVAQELQKAYTLNGRLLRPALVMVAKAPAAEESQEEPGNDPEQE